MVRRMARGWSLIVMAMALALALALPTSTLALNRYRAQAVADWCGSGHMQAVLDLRVTEVGKSGVNHFKIITRAQKAKHRWGPWFTHATWPDYWSTPFADDATTNFIDVYRWFDLDAPRPKYLRLVIKVEFWSYAQGLLKTRTVKGVVC